MISGVNIINYDYNKIAIKKGESYLFSLYVRSVNDSVNNLAINVQDDNGNIGAKAEIKEITNKWGKFLLQAKCTQTISDGELMIKV